MGLATALTAAARTAGGIVATFADAARSARVDQAPAEQRAVGSMTYSPSATYLSGGASMLALDAETRGYAASAVAYRCVEAIASNGASVDLQITRPDGGVIEGHWCSELFNKRPNPAMSAVMFKYLAFAQLELGGQSFAFLDRGETGLAADPSAMHLLFGQVQPVVDRASSDPASADVIGYIATAPDGTRVPLLPDEVLWLRYPHPFRPLEALAPWRAAMHAVEMDANAREWQSSSYRNGARPGGVIYLGDMDEDTHNKTIAAFRSGVEGPRNAGKHLLISTPPGGGDGNKPEYLQLGLSPAEMDYLESRGANAQEVMLAFGVPKDYLLGGATYENRTASKSTLWSDTILPKLTVIASEIDRVMLPSDAEDAGWNLGAVDALQDSQDSVANRVRAHTYADIMMIDEARAEVGLDPLPAGQGAMTLTPYRAQFAAEAGPAAASGDRAWDAVWLHRQLPTIPPAPAPAVDSPPPVAAIATRRQPTAADVLAAYDDLEAIGEAAVRRLAKEQRTAVLRDFDRLMNKPQRSAAWLDEIRTAAVTLAREGALTLEVPDDETTDPRCSTGLEVIRWSTEGAEWETYAVRIRIGEIFDTKHWRQRTKSLFARWFRRTVEEAVEGIDPAADLAEDDPVIVEMDRRLGVLAERVTHTTRQILEARLLQHGVAEGESIPELRARIQQVFTDLEDWRATRVARTETVGGYSAAALQAARANGATHKVWHATNDARTRPSHRAAEGSRTTIDARFRLTQCQHPADPHGPANQSIQCRCYLSFEFEPTEDS
ncbi:phage portal protein [Embleya sp. NPDC050154]|uniref:phage portal protein n=1 Tax=Embleya sp. NPDC050154 TaxID=3363988 RepID=UPI0037B368A7